MNFNSLFFSSARIIFFGRNYFLMYEFFSALFDWPTRKIKTQRIAEKKVRRISFGCASSNLVFRHNYVQLQFHKSMIYSFGLHFYSIRLPYTQKSCNNRGILFFVAIFLTPLKREMRSLFKLYAKLLQGHVSKAIFYLDLSVSSRD